MTALNRRMFLRSATGAVLMIPYLPSMVREARAAGSMPRRYVQFVHRFGRPYEHWYPSDPTEQVAPGVFRRPLADYSGQVSTIIGPSFNALRPKLTLMRGLDGVTKRGVHSWGFVGASSGVPDGKDNVPIYFPWTIDTVMEDATSLYATAPKLRALRVTPMDMYGAYFFGTSYSFKGSTTNALAPVMSTDDAFKKVFDGTTANQPTDDRLVRLKRKLTDSTLDDYKRVSTAARVSSADKLRLSNYMDLVNDLQNRMNAAVRNCGSLELAAGNGMVGLHRNYTDVVVAALACDVTRVVNYNVGLAAQNADGSPVDGDHLHREGHGAHQGDKQSPAKLATQVRWIGERFAELCTKLDAVTEPDGSTVLDNSLVYWGSCQAKGDHTFIDAQVLVAGGAGGTLRTGDYIDFRQRPFRTFPGNWNNNHPDAPGRPYNQFLVTVMRAMGLSPSEWRRDGQTSGFGHYDPFNAEVLALYTDFLSDRDAPLPHWFKA